MKIMEFFFKNPIFESSVNHFKFLILYEIRLPVVMTQSEILEKFKFYGFVTVKGGATAIFLNFGLRPFKKNSTLGFHFFQLILT